MINRKGSNLPVLRENRKGDVLFFTFPTLEETGIVTHGFSSRAGGVSEREFASMNLSFARGDDPERVRENYRRLAAAIGFSPEQMVFTYQTHTANVREVTEEDCGKGYSRERGYTDVDGLVTNCPGVVLTAFFADCVPLYFVDPVKRAIGLAHSGWRGTVHDIAGAAVKKMTELYGSRPADLIAAVGPSICQDCYEVSEDVIEEFRANYPEKLWPLLFEEQSRYRGSARAGQRSPGREKASQKSGGQADMGVSSAAGRKEQISGESGPAKEERTAGGFGPERAQISGEPGALKEERTAGVTGIAEGDSPGRKYQLNLWEACRQNMLRAGLLAERISVTDICTCCNPDILFSHRASHGKRGNLGAFLMLRG